jgi:putative phosphoesterase
MCLDDISNGKSTYGWYVLANRYFFSVRIFYNWAYLRLMVRIGLMSDTHSRLDPLILTKYFADVDEIWHAGDIGDGSVLDTLMAAKPVVAVTGNIDDHTPIAQRLPQDIVREVGGIKLYMTHIGGYPGKYPARIKKALDEHQPGLFVCGHSHILRVMPDAARQLLHLNPGACGFEGFHHMRTAMRFMINKGRVEQLEVIELGLRGTLSNVKP